MASRIEARANPELLVWARETAGFSAGVAADRLKVPVDRLEAWERGEARPSLAQLRKVAQLYRRPLAAFYLPKPPAAEEPVHDFRRMHGQVAGRSSPDLLLAIRRCRERREIVLDFYEEARIRTFISWLHAQLRRGAAILLAVPRRSANSFPPNG